MFGTLVDRAQSGEPSSGAAPSARSFRVGAVPGKLLQRPAIEAAAWPNLIIVSHLASISRCRQLSSQAGADRLLFASGPIGFFSEVLAALMWPSPPRPAAFAGGGSLLPALSAAMPLTASARGTQPSSCRVSGRRSRASGTNRQPRALPNAFLRIPRICFSVKRLRRIVLCASPDPTYSWQEPQGTRHSPWLDHRVGDDTAERSARA